MAAARTGGRSRTTGRDGRRLDRDLALLGADHLAQHRPLGAPAGPRVQLGPYKWRRDFAHATVTVDLDEPLGPGTNIDWG